MTTASSTLTLMEKRGTLKRIGYLLGQAGKLKLDGVDYPLDTLEFDDTSEMLNVILRATGKYSEELLNIDIVPSQVKGHNFNITVTVLQIDVPISFIYHVEKAIISMDKGLLERDLVIKPSFRRLKDSLNFRK